MKITKTFVSVFLVTFLIGYVSFWLLNLCKAESTFCQVYEINPVKIQTEIEVEKEKMISPPDKGFNSKVFNVEGFWDELENQYNKHLIETGEISNGEDFKIKSGETWIGLFGKNETSYLLPTKIRVQRTDDSDLSWKVISAKTNEKPLFLVKNLKKVTTGKVKTIFRGTTWQEFDQDENKKLTTLGKGFVKKFTLGESSICFE